MLTKRQRDRIPLGVERFQTDHRARDLEEAERQVIDAAFALMNILPSKLFVGEWKQYMELDYALETLATARNKLNEVPPLPDWVEGVSYDEPCKICKFMPCSCQ